MVRSRAPAEEPGGLKDCPAICDSRERLLRGIAEACSLTSGTGNRRRTDLFEQRVLFSLGLLLPGRGPPSVSILGSSGKVSRKRDWT